MKAAKTNDQGATESKATESNDSAKGKGTLPSLDVECRMFQIVKYVGNNAFLSAPFKGGGWRDDDSVGSIMAEIDKTVCVIVSTSGNSVKYLTKRNPAEARSAFVPAT